MTPEQRADALVNCESFYDLVRHSDTIAMEQLIAKAIADAIREAVAAERERCAAIVEADDIQTCTAWYAAIDAIRNPASSPAGG